VVLNKSKVKAWAERHGVSEKPLIDVEAFIEEVEWEEDGEEELEEDEEE
jgi:hypothetical protein